MEGVWPRKGFKDREKRAVMTSSDWVRSKVDLCAGDCVCIGLKLGAEYVCVTLYMASCVLVCARVCVCVCATCLGLFQGLCGQHPPLSGLYLSLWEVSE